MSSSKHIDKICIAAVCVMLVITVLFMNGGSLGLSAVPRAMKYAGTLFDTSYVHSIDIVMNDWTGFIENCENEEYVSCTAVIDGKQYKNTAIRAKGNTSLSSVRSSGSQRYSFKLEFDHYENGKSMDGLDKLCLNNLIQDNTLMKDYLAYRLMDDFGVDAPLCSYAYVTVNGADWGLYLAVEGVEDSFLERNYGSDTGELYKPDSMSFGGGRGNGKGFKMDDLDFGDFDFGDFDFSGFARNGADASGQTGEAEEQTSELPNGDMQQPGMGMQPGEALQQSGGDAQPPEMLQLLGAVTPSGNEDSQPDTAQAFGGGFDFSRFAGVNGRETDAQSRVGGFGMGSSDVKLMYIDDNPESYPNIFDNAKTEVSDKDKERLVSSLKGLSGQTNLENVLDTDEVLRYFVVHNFVVNGDSYTGSMIHNYYLHEKDGRLAMIPWDYNLAFGSFRGGSAASSVNELIDSPVSGGMSDRPMISWIFSDAAYTEMYHALFYEFIEKWFTDGELEALIGETRELIRPYVIKDPTRFCTLEEFDAGVDAIGQFVTLRAEAVSRQLKGDDTAVSTDGLTVSDMGTMGGGFGGGDRKTNDAGMRTFGMRTDNRSARTGKNDAAQADGTQPEDSQKPESTVKPEDIETAEKSEKISSSAARNTGFQWNFQAMQSERKTVTDKDRWLLVGSSVLVLILGLVIAIKKKY